MKQRRKIEISLQLNEVVAIRNPRVWLTSCPKCHTRTRMIPANEAALASNRSSREIHRFAEVGRLHFVEDQDGLLYICFESLQGLAIGSEHQATLNSHPAMKLR